MVNLEGGWDSNYPKEMLPIEIGNIILAIPPPCSIAVLNSLTWEGSKDEDFSLAVAYQTITNGIVIQHDPLCKVKDPNESVFFEEVKPWCLLYKCQEVFEVYSR